MQKLINAYKADPSLANAKKLAAQARKHPMSVCFLDASEQVLLAAAQAQVG